MSRVAKKPIAVPKGVTVNIDGHKVSVKGGKGALERQFSDLVKITLEEAFVYTSPKNEASTEADALAGCTRMLIQNMITGVADGFERKLELVGVGYRAQAQGNKLNLTLG